MTPATVTVALATPAGRGPNLNVREVTLSAQLPVVLKRTGKEPDSGKEPRERLVRRQNPVLRS
jgi:hypothetical protein